MKTVAAETVGAPLEGEGTEVGRSDDVLDRPRRPHLRRIARAVGIVSVMAVLGVAALEAALRLYDRVPLAPRIFRPVDLKVGYGLRPSIVADYEHDGRTVRVTTDREGRRLVTGRGSASPAVTVHVIGDSQVFGWGLTDVETLPSRLQAKLGPDWAVVNHGVPGYGPFAYVEILERIPDDDLVVVVQTELNDFQDAYTVTAPAVVRGGFLLRPGFSGESLPVAVLGSHVFVRLTELAIVLGDSRLPAPLGYDPATEGAARVLSYRIEKLFRLPAARRRWRLVRSVIPWDAAILPDRLGRYRPHLAGATPRVELTDDCSVRLKFLDHPERERLFQRDSHLSAVGCDVLADVLAAELRARRSRHRTNPVSS